MTGSHRDLPRTDDVRPPREGVLRALRPSARATLSRRYAVRSHGAEHIIMDGPLIVASNHVGLIDGPLMAAYLPRILHALTKREMFEGSTGRFLRATGQVPLDRDEVDVAAIKTCIRVLRDGGVVGIYPEGTRGSGELNHVHAGVAYLALVTGAPVLPVAVFGTREPGGGLNSVPPRGTEIDIVYGGPVRVESVPWPRTREQTRETSTLLHGALRAHLDLARELTGRELPGPIPQMSPGEVTMTEPASTKELLDD